MKRNTNEVPKLSSSMLCFYAHVQLQPLPLLQLSLLLKHISAQIDHFAHRAHRQNTITELVISMWWCVEMQKYLPPAFLCQNIVHKFNFFSFQLISSLFSNDAANVLILLYDVFVKHIFKKKSFSSAFYHLSTHVLSMNRSYLNKLRK